MKDDPLSIVRSHFGTGRSSLGEIKAHFIYHTSFPLPCLKQSMTFLSKVLYTMNILRSFHSTLFSNRQLAYHNASTSSSAFFTSLRVNIWECFIVSVCETLTNREPNKKGEKSHLKSTFQTVHVAFVTRRAKLLRSFSEKTYHFSFNA